MKAKCEDCGKELNNIQMKCDKCTEECLSDSIHEVCKI